MQVIVGMYLNGLREGTQMGISKKAHQIIH